MKTENLLLGLAVIAVVVSIIGVGITYNSVLTFQQWITGRATDTGTINLTIESTALINFTTNNIDFGSGQVDAGESNALLISNDTVDRGNWTGAASGFVVENIGNNNVTLSLATADTADTFIGGSNPEYQYKVTDGGGETGSCNATDISLDTFYDVNTTGDGTEVCNPFATASGMDTINIDIRLLIPADSPNTGSVLGDTMTATYSAV